MSDKLQRISLRMESNKLTVKEGKNKFLQFKPKLNCKINLNNKALKLTNEMKNLGVTLDNTPKYKQHKNHFINRLSSQTGKTYHHKLFLSRKSLLTLC